MERKWRRRSKKEKKNKETEHWAETGKEQGQGREEERLVQASGAHLLQGRHSPVGP